ncbi:MAG: hypothetical protein WCO33_03370 [bacterium]
MKYGNQSRQKNLLPFRKELCLGQKINDKTKTRLRWIDYVEEGNSVLKHQGTSTFQKLQLDIGITNTTSTTLRV